MNRKRLLKVETDVPKLNVDGSSPFTRFSTTFAEDGQAPEFRRLSTKFVFLLSPERSETALTNATTRHQKISHEHRISNRNP